MVKGKKYLSFTGGADLRTRIVCSLLTGKAIRIDDIRAFDENPGVRDFEVSLFRLIETICNGCKIKINETGTSLKFSPGILWGGGEDGIELVHDCPLSRGIGYFIEFLLLVAPFCKQTLSITLKGLTNDDQNRDRSVDLLRTVSFPLLEKFGGVAFGCKKKMIKVKKRGAPPLGGGEVYFLCPVVKKFKSIDMIKEGRVKRVRGLAWATKCSAQMCNRMVKGARGVFNNFLADVYIYTDHYTGKESGNCPGYGMTLVVETTTGVILSAELCGRKGDVPEQLGNQIAKLLLREIEKGGVVDSCHQSQALLYMLLCPEDVSKIRLGKLTQHTIDSLRVYRTFFGLKFMIKADPTNQTILLSGVGIGYENYARKTI